MNEFKKAFRHIWPGFIFIIELTIILLISGAVTPMQIMDFVSGTKSSLLHYGNVVYQADQSDGSLKNGLLGFFGALFLSGGLGYFFSVIYHTVVFHPLRASDKGIKFSTSWNMGSFAVDHRSVIEFACNRGWTRLVYADIPEAPYKKEEDYKVVLDDRHKLTVSGAWRIATSFWHATVKKKHTRNATDMYSDVLHGSGTSLVAGVSASITASWITFTYQTDHYIALFILMVCLFLVFHIFNYFSLSGITMDLSIRYC